MSEAQPSPESADNARGSFQQIADELLRRQYDSREKLAEVLQDMFGKWSASAAEPTEEAKWTVDDLVEELTKSEPSRERMSKLLTQYLQTAPKHLRDELVLGLRVQYATKRLNDVNEENRGLLTLLAWALRAKPEMMNKEADAVHWLTFQHQDRLDYVVQEMEGILYKADPESKKAQ